MMDDGLGNLDHRSEVDIGLIKLKHCEFGIVTRTDAFVAENYD